MCVFCFVTWVELCLCPSIKRIKFCNKVNQFLCDQFDASLILYRVAQKSNTNKSEQCFIEEFPFYPHGETMSHSKISALVHWFVCPLKPQYSFGEINFLWFGLHSYPKSQVNWSSDLFFVLTFYNGITSTGILISNHV